MDGMVPAADQPGPAQPGAAPQAAHGERWQGTFGPPVLPPQAPRAPGAWRQDVLRVVREPFTRHAIRERQYAALSFFLAIPGFVLVAVAMIVGLGLSLSFAGMAIGVPLLTVSLLGARKLGAVNRRLAGRILGQQVAPPPPPSRRPGAVGWIRSGLTDAAGWRACAYLVLKLPVAVAAAVIASWILVYGLPYLTFPLWWAVLHQLDVVVTVPQWMAWWKTDPVTVAMSVRTLAGAFALVPVGALVLIAVPWVARGIIRMDQGLIAEFLGPPPAQRVRDLERSRAHAVDDSAARLRRIERDLHDGAQAQMVAVAMKLGLAREKLGGTAGATAEADFERALELVDAAHASAKQAITELRDLARGIHPPVLDHGLGTALATLAAGSSVPVDLVVDLPERPSAAIETIAYFCAAELLANVAKHSGARRATLEVVHVPGLLRLRVSDDGAGGAHVEAGGGLAGLAGRLRTVDGTIHLSSPRGGPTVVTVEMPSHA
jgi:signal transduction histidine kinase